jgi:hypothetical protein
MKKIIIKRAEIDQDNDLSSNEPINKSNGNYLKQKIFYIFLLFLIFLA